MPATIAARANQGPVGSLPGARADARRGGEAIARLDRALQLEVTRDDAFQVALARAYLGRAQVETRRDVVAGLAAARSARTALAAAADASNADSVRELDAWLAAH